MILPIGMICIGKIPLSAKGITDVTTYNHPIDICSVPYFSKPFFCFQGVFFKKCCPFFWLPSIQKGFVIKSGLWWLLYSMLNGHIHIEGIQWFFFPRYGLILSNIQRNWFAISSDDQSQVMSCKFHKLCYSNVLVTYLALLLSSLSLRSFK